LTTFLIDVAIIGIIGFCAWRGYKNGLIRGVFGIVSLVVSLFVANVAAQAYSDEATSMLMPFVSGMIESTVTEMSETGIEYQALAHDHDNDDADFGTAYTALRQLGMPEASAVRLAERSLEVEPHEENNYFSDIIASRLTSALSYVAVFGIAFLLIAIVFAVIGNLVGLVFALPGLKLIDIIAGSVLGITKGIIIVYAIAVIIRYYGLLISSTFEGTSILKFIVNNNPIADLLGI